MKTFLKFAAAFASLAAVSPALAQTGRAGQSELATRPAPGPSRSGLLARVRVPMGDAPSAMADCECPMMKASATGCMMGMPGKQTSRPNG